MKINYILLMILLLAISCRQEEEIDGATLYPVDFNLPGIEVITRVAETESLPSDAPLTIAAYNSDTHELAAQGNYQVSDGSLVPADNGKPLTWQQARMTFVPFFPPKHLPTMASRLRSVGEQTF